MAPPYPVRGCHGCQPSLPDLLLAGRLQAENARGGQGAATMHQITTQFPTQSVDFDDETIWRMILDTSLVRAHHELSKADKSAAAAVATADNEGSGAELRKQASWWS